MFATLLAEEFRASVRFYLTLAGGSFAFYAALGVFNGIGNYSGEDGASIGLGLLALMGEFVILCVFWTHHWSRYWQTMHGTRASFTHSLPVKARWIFLAKALWLLAGTGALYVWQCVMRFLFGLLSSQNVEKAWGSALYMWNSAAVSGTPLWVRMLAAVALAMTPLAVFAGMSLGCSPNFMGGRQRLHGNHKEIIAGRAHPVAGVLFALVWTLVCWMLGGLGIPIGVLTVRGQYQEIIFGSDLDPAKYTQAVPADTGVELIGGHFTTIAAVLILCWWVVGTLEKHLHVR